MQGIQTERVSQVEFNLPVINQNKLVQNNSLASWNHKMPISPDNLSRGVSLENVQVEDPAQQTQKTFKITQEPTPI